MKNKIFKLTALLLLVVGFVACQKDDVDVFGISTGLALEKMPGYYTFTEVDSVTMTVTKTECCLEKQVDGVGKGYYLVSKSGVNPSPDDKKLITWDAVMAENKLSMTTTITFSDGETKVFRWSEGVLYDASNKVSTKTAKSSVDALKTINADLANKAFEIDQKSYYPHPDTIEFVAWTTDVTYFAPEDTTSAKANYLAELAPYNDTIKWYIKNIGQIGTVYIDSVTGELQNLVVIDPTPSSRGKNKGKHGITHVIQIDTLQSRVEQIKDRPQELLSSNVEFKVAGSNYTGSYNYHQETWTEEWYLKPGSPEAIYTDSAYAFVATKWAVTAVSNDNVFDVLMKGSENGKPQVSFTTIHVSEFNREKGELVIGTLKYLLKQ